MSSGAPNPARLLGQGSLSIYSQVLIIPSCFARQSSCSSQRPLLALMLSGFSGEVRKAEKPGHLLRSLPLCGSSSWKELLTSHLPPQPL